MKTQPKDATALAMDWLAQLRDEDGAEVPRGGRQPAIDGEPPAGDLGDVSPAAEWGNAAPAPPAAHFEDPAPAGPPAALWADAPLVPLPAGDVRDAAPAGPPAAIWGDAPLVPLPAGDVRDPAPAGPPAAGWRDEHPAAPPSVGWREAAQHAVGSGEARPAAPTADWWFPAPAISAAAAARHAAPPPAGNSGPPAVLPDTTTAGRAGKKADIEITERAAIGDELRIPLAWCEMGSCISHYADPAALGEADIRTRAIAAGWRVDALGRLACPQCQQGDSWFWTAHPVALWDRDTAVAMTTLMAAAARQATRGGATAGVGRAAPRGRAPRAVPGPRPEIARAPGQG